MEGLECTPDPRQAELPDLPNKCQPAEKKEGESCGPCLSLTGDCGTCMEGLECTPDPRQAEMPDFPNKCQPAGKGIFILAWVLYKILYSPP